MVWDIYLARDLTTLSVGTGKLHKDRNYQVNSSLADILFFYISDIFYIAGFGLGALNDADEDDFDVYDLSHSARDGGRHQAYDTSEREDDDKIVIGQSQARTHHKQVS